MRYAKYITKTGCVSHHQLPCSLRRSACYCSDVDPFELRSRTKRTGYLAPIRVSDHEKQIIEWLAKRLSEREGRAVSQADVIRQALALLYEREQSADKANNELSPIEPLR